MNISLKGCTDGVFHNTGNTPSTAPTLNGTHTEADNRKATPRHIGRDANVQGASGALLSTHFWTSYIGILFSPPFLHLTHIYILFIPNLHIII